MTVAQMDPPLRASLRTLVVDDESTIRTTLTICLEAAGHHVAAFGTIGPALEIAEKEVFDLLLLDLRLGTDNGLDFIARFLEKSPWLKIVVITAYASIETAVEAMRRGATDYLAKPFTPEQVELLAARVAEVRALEIRLSLMSSQLGDAEPPAILETKNRKMHAAIDMARRFAPSDTALLLQGESGTGKKDLARAVHSWSKRSAGPFMTMSCSQRDEAQLAAELLGAAVEGRQSAGQSRLELCAGGTLYIDDVAALPSRLQSEILRVIQSRQFERDGAFALVDANVRIILGIQLPPQVAANADVLRQDLYFALAGNTIELPALRERAEDFIFLAECFLAFHLRRQGKQPRRFSDDALAYLAGYAWPGNLRELHNVVERAAILSNSAKIEISDFPPNLRTTAAAPAALGDLVALELIQEHHIRGVLAKCDSLELAATILGIDGATLWRRRQKYGL